MDCPIEGLRGPQGDVQLLQTAQHFLEFWSAAQEKWEERQYFSSNSIVVVLYLIMFKLVFI